MGIRLSRLSQVEPARTGELRERDGALRLCLRGAADPGEAHWLYADERVRVRYTDGTVYRGTVVELAPETFKLAAEIGVLWVHVSWVAELSRSQTDLPLGLR